MAYRLAFKQTGITEAQILGSDSLDSSFDNHEKVLVELDQLKR